MSNEIDIVQQCKTYNDFNHMNKEFVVKAFTIDVLAMLSNQFLEPIRIDEHQTNYRDNNKEANHFSVIPKRVKT